MAVFRPVEMPDYQNYYDAFRFGGLQRAEIGYKVVMGAIKDATNSFSVLLLVMASLSIGLKLYAIGCFSNNVLLSVIIYLSNIYILHDLIQMRAAVASGLLLFATYFIYTRNVGKFLLIVTLGSLFHQSMLATLPLWLLRCNHIYRYVWLSLIPIAYCMTLSGLTIGNFVSHIPIPIVQNSYQQYNLAMAIGNYSEINIFNLLLILRIVLCMTLIFMIHRIYKYNRLAIIWVKVYTIAIVSAVILSDFPVLAVRLSELFFVIEILLFPLIVNIFKSRCHVIGRLSVIGLSLIMLLINTFYINILV